MDDIDLTSSSSPAEGNGSPPAPSGAGTSSASNTNPVPAAGLPTRQIDPAIALANKNIEELNNIDEKISSLLLSAGLAIKALTTPIGAIDPANPTASTTASTSTQPPPPPTTIPSQLSVFKSHASTFYVLLDSIRVLLRRQILLQEQAEILAILPPGATAPSAAGVSGPAAGAGGAAGGFDLGLLNVRSDAVEKDMEAELWAKAKLLVDSLVRAKEDVDVERQLLGGGGGDEGSGPGGNGGQDTDVEMGS